MPPASALQGLLREVLLYGLLSEGLFDAVFECRERGSVTGGAEASDIGLGVVLVAVLQVTGKGDVFDLPCAMDLHERCGDGVEGAGFAGARVDYRVNGLPGAVGQQTGEKHVDAGEVFDEDEVAALLAVGVAA